MPACHHAYHDSMYANRLWHFLTNLSCIYRPMYLQANRGLPLHTILCHKCLSCLLLTGLHNENTDTSFVARMRVALREPYTQRVKVNISSGCAYRRPSWHLGNQQASESLWCGDRDNEEYRKNIIAYQPTVGLGWITGKVCSNAVVNSASYPPGSQISIAVVARQLNPVAKSHQIVGLIG
jgi:hypothetical protein